MDYEIQVQVYGYTQKTLRSSMVLVWSYFDVPKGINEFWVNTRLMA